MILIALLVGVIIGGVLIGWLFCRSAIAEKIESVETGLHTRLALFENRIAAKFGHAETAVKTEAQAVEKRL
jgi:uncharacterized membrane-anchored protein YhcB (DUF1043 family)